ncbi:ATP-binding protein [Rhodococcus kronopolitis]|uniref:ATP-binding protein n=1 Tax=Rhodococcus kronopolitis TaxID=1460226 RepID=A0ABV9FWW8_9NOCA
MATAVRVKVGNLPLELTSFVGRRHEVAEVRRLLSSARLVTLTGTGGVGKTRLALRVAADARRSFADGVWLCELGELHDGDLTANAVATALGYRQQAAMTPTESLVEEIGDRQLLLVLDNCEHVVADAAVLAEALLRSCRELRILATSREALGIGGESVLRVPPLAVPDPSRPPTLKGLPGFDAVTLFEQRAAAAVPDFGISEDNRAAVTGICARLDGLPLLIELAAVRMRALSAEQILDRLTDRYRLLTGGSRAAPSRQQTLQLCIDWSHELCTPSERDLWRRLSVFAGGFELDAVEGICLDDPASPPRGDDLLDTLASLVDKSILISEQRGTVVRFRMFETIREYGRERLAETGGGEVLRRRHRDWYADLAARAEAEWIGPLQLEWIDRLGSEQPNMRAALDFCLDDPEAGDLGLRTASAMFQFWLSQGQYGEGRRWLGRLLAARGGRPTLERVKALYKQSVLAGLQGDVPAGIDLVREAGELAGRLGDDESRAFATYAEGRLAMRRGRLEEAVAVFEVSVGAFRARGNLLMEISALQGLSMASGLLGSVDRAVTCCGQVLALTEPRGESLYRARALWTLGLVLWELGDDNNRAEELVREGLSHTRMAGDAVSAGWCLQILAWIGASEHKWERAAVLMGATEVLCRGLGGTTVIVPTLLARHQEVERRTRQALGGGFESVFGRGRGFTPAEAFAFALEEDVTPAPRSGDGGPVKLTRREQQVAELVAQGLTNREVAGKLVIAQRTAQGHVEHVLAKLGFTSRAQIAAWMAERGQAKDA